MEFVKGLQINTSHLVETINGADYVSWASALALAGLPAQTVEMFGGLPYRKIFGGALVCISQPVAPDIVQKTWLPALGADNASIPVERLTSRAVHDTIMRARAKSVAQCNGVGLSLYADFGGNGPGFFKALGITPESDLSQAEPLVKQKGKTTRYVPWAVALAAARITDPNFVWEVVEFETSASDWDDESRIETSPFLRVANGYMVAVRVTWRGRTHTEMLPIMGVREVMTPRGPRKMDHVTLEAPSVWDWNKAVMRCLAKAIAVVSGYGISIYAGEDIDAIRNAEAPQQEAVQQDDGGDDEELLRELEQLLPSSEQGRQRILAACAKRGWVDSIPSSTQELVRSSKDAARRLLEALRKRASAEA